MKDLTRGNIYKTFILFAIPMVLAGVLSQGYAIVDTIIAGKFLGDSGLAAIGATSALISFICSMFWGYGTGFSIYMAKLFGAKEYEKIKSAVYSNLLLFFTVTVLVSAGLMIFHEPIFDALKIDEAIRKEAFIYYAVCTIGNFFVVITPCGGFLMNAFGISKFPLYMSVISTILNISGNILSVAVFNFGILGIGLSTVFASFVLTMCYIIKLKSCYREMGVEKNKVAFSYTEIKEVIGYAVPVMLQQMIMTVASLVIAPMVNGIGGAATAAYTVILRIYNINASVYQNSAKTLSNYTAQCMGAKKYNKIRKGVGVGLLQGLIFLSPVLIICVVFAEPVCRAFFPSDYTGQGLDYTITFARFCMPLVLFNVLNNLFHSFCRGVKAMKLLVISTALATIIRVIATALLVDSLGMNGIYIGWAVSWIGEAIIAVIIYMSGIWKPEQMRENL